jgi:membrane protein
VSLGWSDGRRVWTWTTLSRVDKPSFLQRKRDQYPWLDHLIRAAQRYQDNNGDHYAAAIAYFSVLALFPLLMIAFSVLGFVLFRNPDLIDLLKSKLIEAAPEDLGKPLAKVVDTAVKQRTAVGIIGLVGAAYSGLGWIGNLREALTAQWEQVHEKGNFVKAKAGDAFALVGLGTALVVSLGLTAAGTGFSGLVLRWLRLAGYGWAHVLLAGITILLALFGNWLVFLWVISRLPREPVTLRSAARAAVIGAIGFEILKQAATLFLSSLSGSAGAIFGPVIGLMVFAYLVSRFILFVTAWAATARENEHRVVEPPPAAVFRPALTVQAGPDGRTAAGLLSAGALFGAGLAWVLRRR